MTPPTLSVDPRALWRDGTPVGANAEQAYRDVVEELTYKASFLWILRDSEVNQPHRRPADIAHLDRRLETAVDGLMIAPARIHLEGRLVSDNIEYQEDATEGVFRYTALAVGPGTVSVDLLDKQTLWVFTDTVPVNVEPEK
jgi:hypothetical protein